MKPFKKKEKKKTQKLTCSNKVRKKLFGLFCPLGLSILTSSHFQEERLAESWLQLNPFYAVSLKDWKVAIPIKQLVFSSPARLQGNHIKLRKTTTQSLVFHLIFHTNLRSDYGLATSEVLVTQKKLHTRSYSEYGCHIT